MVQMFELNNDKIKSHYSGINYTIEQIPDLLNQMDWERTRTENDMKHTLELKAVNRHLRIENRVLAMKIEELAYRGLLDYTQIKKEITEICSEPDRLSEYIHSFEEENFKLKQELKKLGKYNGDLL